MWKYSSTAYVPGCCVSIDESVIVPDGWGMASLLLLIGASDVALKEEKLYGYHKHSTNSRTHSIRMRSARLQIIHASKGTSRCHLGGVPEMNKFERVSSDGHQMSLARVDTMAKRGPMSHVQREPVQ